MHPVLYLSTLLTASAAYLPLHPRAYSDPCVADIQDNEQVFNDAVTADGTAGIGAEFESPFFYFVNDKCSPDDTNAARKKVVAERTGTNWELTADTGASRSGGKLNAEYILDGREIKVGGDGDKVAKSIADDLVSAISILRFVFSHLHACRLRGSRGKGLLQTTSILKIINAIHGESMLQMSTTIQPKCRGSRRSLRQCLLRLCIAS